MSSDAGFILDVIPSGVGCVLDLGGNRGMLRPWLEQRGYHYINLDICHFEHGEPSLLGDAHFLPFKTGSFDMVISKDTLEHFINPWMAVSEVYRILKEGGMFVVWVPFMHPFHETDYYRYSPLGLQYILRDFKIVRFESPLWVFTIFGMAAIELLKRVKLEVLVSPLMNACTWLDRSCTRHRKAPAAFCPAYRIVAQKIPPTRISSIGLLAIRRILVIFF
jgi:SAM-dependent methyltransferase